MAGATEMATLLTTDWGRVTPGSQRPSRADGQTTRRQLAGSPFWAVDCGTRLSIFAWSHFVVVHLSLHSLHLTNGKMGASSSHMNQLGHSHQRQQGKCHELPSDQQPASHPSFLHPRGVQTLDSAAKKKRHNLASFATLKKRLVRRNRRTSKSFDHGQVLRHFLAGWSTRDLLQLVEEYESTGLLKELSFQAEIARPTATTVSHDLAELYDFKYAADTYLIFRGVHFPVHKALVCVRCPFFRELLGKINTFGARVQVNSLDQIPGLRPEIFNDLLRYLYSGELSPTAPLTAIDPSTNPTALQLTGDASTSYEGVLLRLSERFGVPNDLDRDMKHLLETGLYSDACLCFSGNNNCNDHGASSSMTRKCRSCSDQAEYSCHSAVLASRSPFFKNVVLRHQRRFAEMAAKSDQMINTANQKIKIVLDESIVPRRFARVILHSMYRDSTDILSILPSCVCTCALLNQTPDPLTGSCPYGITGASSSVGVNGANSTCVPGSIVAHSMNSLASSATLTSSIAAGLSSHSSSLASFSSAGLGPGNSRDSSAPSPVPYMISGSCSNSISSGSTVTSHTGLYVKEIMDLYEIARFLELDSLIQTCEDMIIDSLSIETLVTVLKWSEQPYGSPWVRRQALHFLREEFSSISSSNVLYQLELSHLVDALKSSFLQASELEVLQAVIKWGENKLLKKMEEREPNLISQTNHSLRRNMRKRELSDSELRDTISELMGYVRIGHILPTDSEILNNSVKRGLIATLPQYMVGEDGAGVPVSGITSWLHGKGSGPFQCPRYFTPYVDEAKTYLEERLRRPGEMIPRRDRAITSVPDLYMIDNGCPRPSTTDAAFNQMTTSTSSEIYSTPPCCPPHPSSSAFNHSAGLPNQGLGMHNDSHLNHSQHHHTSSHTSNLPLSTCTAQQIPQLPVIEQRILVLMKQREAELKSSVLGTHAMIPDRCEVSRIIQLRVVREFGLPDSAAEVLHNTASYIPYPSTETESATDEMTASYGITGMAPSSGVLSNIGSNGALQSDKDIYNTYPGHEIIPEPSECDIEPCRNSPIPPPPPMSDVYLTYSFEDDYLGGHRTMSIRDTMPDIALATSALAEMHLHKRSTESLALTSVPPPPSRPGQHHSHSRSIPNIVALTSPMTSSPSGSLIDETMTLGSVRRRPSVPRDRSCTRSGSSSRFTSSASVQFLS